jgi:hypothetical protein
MAKVSRPRPFVFKKGILTIAAIATRLNISTNAFSII